MPPLQMLPSLSERPQSVSETVPLPSETIDETSRCAPPALTSTRDTEDHAQSSRPSLQLSTCGANQSSRTKAADSRVAQKPSAASPFDALFDCSHMATPQPDASGFHTSHGNLRLAEPSGQHSEAAPPKQGTIEMSGQFSVTADLMATQDTVEMSAQPSVSQNSVLKEHSQTSSLIQQSSQPMRLQCSPQHQTAGHLPAPAQVSFSGDAAVTTGPQAEPAATSPGPQAASPLAKMLSAAAPTSQDARPSTSPVQQNCESHAEATAVLPGRLEQACDTHASADAADAEVVRHQGSSCEPAPVVTPRASRATSCQPGNIAADGSGSGRKRRRRSAAASPAADIGSVGGKRSGRSRRTSAAISPASGPHPAPQPGMRLLAVSPQCMLRHAQHKQALLDLHSIRITSCMLSHCESCDHQTTKGLRSHLSLCLRTSLTKP